MHWKFQCRNKKQDKKIMRLKLYGTIRNARLKLEPNVLVKKKLIARNTSHKVAFLAKRGICRHFPHV